MGAQPKRRRTRSRRYARRAQIRLSTPNMGRCLNCRNLVTSHQVCPMCGNFRGSGVLQPSEQASKYR